MSSNILVVLYIQAGSCRNNTIMWSSSINIPCIVNYCMLTVVITHLHCLRFNLRPLICFLRNIEGVILVIRRTVIVEEYDRNYPLGCLL